MCRNFERKILRDIDIDHFQPRCEFSFGIVLCFTLIWKLFPVVLDQYCPRRVKLTILIIEYVFFVH